MDSNPYAPPTEVSNPYAPPAEASVPPTLPSDVFFFCDGDFLVIRDGAELPNVCLRTNEPAGEGSWRKKRTMTWNPPWVFVLILVNILVLIIVALVTQKKAKMTYSLSAAARAAIVKKRGIAFFLLLATIGLFYVGFTQMGDLVWVGMFGGIISLIASLVFFAIADPIKVVKFHDGWFRIKGCSKEFLATLPVRFSPF